MKFDANTTNSNKNVWVEHRGTRAHHERTQHEDDEVRLRIEPRTYNNTTTNLSLNNKPRATQQQRT